eukprot:2497567-Amphidinium_carterae.1
MSCSLNKSGCRWVKAGALSQNGYEAGRMYLSQTSCMHIMLWSSICKLNIINHSLGFGGKVPLAL